MSTKLVLFAFAAASAVVGAPMPATPTDVSVLSFALTLEHLENAFYTQGLAKYSESDFQKDGLPPWARGRFVQIAQHESEHVKYLTEALGDRAPQPCEYNFPDDSPKTFAAMSMIFETVGASAYLGSAKSLADNADYLTAAGSILAVESRQASWVTASVMKLQPWNGPFDIPLTPSGAFSLAAPFIKSCPSSNAPLPIKPYPSLKLSTTTPTHGSAITASYTKPKGDTSSDSKERYVAWMDGLSVVYSTLDQHGKATVPKGLMGTVYAVVVSSKETPSEDNMLSGYALAQFPFDSMVKEEGPAYVA
ncbi:ferritin-like domain-containing protein [Cubamyces lactineus]|nr:ferritin-like domain-containing protein [Cubamyces lactineus]